MTNTRYRGATAEGHASTNHGAPAPDEEHARLVPQMRHPPRGDAHPALDDARIKMLERQARKEAAQREEEAAEARSDEPVEVGSFVFVRQAESDMTAGFAQPLVLCLVVGISAAVPSVCSGSGGGSGGGSGDGSGNCSGDGSGNGSASANASGSGSGSNGSTDHEDELSVQYMTSSGYDNQYRPAVMTNTDVKAHNKNQSVGSKLPQNTVWTGQVKRGNVVIANVVTTHNKVGTGVHATASLITAFSDVLAPARRSTLGFKIDGYTTKRVLRGSVVAEYEKYNTSKSRK